jgi:MarR family transcriptional regulator, transcriptional regulator for hemolysin
MKRSIVIDMPTAAPAPGPASAPTILDDGSLSYLVKLTYATMRRGLDASLRAAGLTVPQWRALGVLLHKPGATHSELVRHLEIEAPSVTSLVNGMQRKGWLRQERSATDARAKRLYLTAAGKRVLGTARSACSPVQSHMEEILPPAERAELKRLLRTVVDGMR